MNASKAKTLILYLLLFFGAWTLTEIFLSDKLQHLLPDPALFHLVKDGVIKNLLWTLPALLLIRRYEKSACVPLGEMFKSRVRWRIVLPVLLLFTAYLLTGAYLQKGHIALSGSFRPWQLLPILFVGITEEAVFRGWILNVTVRREKPLPALMLSALLFLIIHFPIWIHDGVFLQTFADFSFLSVFALGAIFGWLFLRTRNLFAPILLHMYWNLLITLFY